MQCEKCGKREARVKITRIINGVSETHHYCRECAEEMTGKAEKPNEWSQAVFKLLREMFIKASQENNKELQEKAAGLACPVCGRTYQEFAENGLFGCSACYEAFEPVLGAALMSMQGTASHHGKGPVTSEKDTDPGDPFNEEAVSPEEEIEILEARLEEAVREERYEDAAHYRDEIRSRRENSDG